MTMPSPERPKLHAFLGRYTKLLLTTHVNPDGDGLGSMLALDEALSKLATLDPRAAQVVELRFFGGLEESQVAEVLGVSAITVKRDWKAASLFSPARLSWPSRKKRACTRAPSMASERSRSVRDNSACRSCSTRIVSAATASRRSES